MEPGHRVLKPGWSKGDIQLGSYWWFIVRTGGHQLGVEGMTD